MDLTNDSYVIQIRWNSSTERYLRDRDGWLKVSSRGRTFRMTAEQVLNHLLPACAGLKPGLSIAVEHREPRATRRATPRARAPRPSRPAPVPHARTRRGSRDSTRSVRSRVATPRPG